MAHLTIADAVSRTIPMADKRDPKKWKPGGTPGKLHREMNVPEGDKIPAAKLDAATHSSDPEKRRDAIRAKTMEGWHHGSEHRKKQLASAYNHPTSSR